MEEMSMIREPIDREKLYIDLFNEMIVHRPEMTPKQCKKRALEAVKALFEERGAENEM
jgi:hypothetical protein